MVANKNEIFIFSLNIKNFLTVFTSKLLFLESLFQKCNKNDNRSDKLYLPMFYSSNRLPLTSHDWDSIDICGTDHCCTVIVVVVVRPIVYDVTRMGLNQLFLGLAIFVSIC